MDVDHVHTDELLPTPDRLSGDFSDVRDELELQVARLPAAAAGAHVQFDEPTLCVEDAVQGHRCTGDGGQRRRPVESVEVAGEEGRVALDLDELEVPRGVDDLVEHTSRRGLRVPEDAAVELHVLGVAADVGNQKQRTPGCHGWTLTVRDGS